MSDTVTVRRDELEWLLAEKSLSPWGCVKCPVRDGCMACDFTDCLARLRARFMPEATPIGTG